MSGRLRDIEAQQIQIGKGRGRSSAIAGKGQRESELESVVEAMKKLVDKLKAERKRPLAERRRSDDGWPRSFPLAPILWNLASDWQLKNESGKGGQAATAAPKEFRRDTGQG